MPPNNSVTHEIIVHGIMPRNNSVIRELIARGIMPCNNSVIRELIAHGIMPRNNSDTDRTNHSRAKQPGWMQSTMVIPPWSYQN